MVTKLIKPRNPNDYHSYSKDEPLPEHRFVFNETIGISGSRKGIPSTKVVLYIGNRVYKRCKSKSGRIFFSCNGCQKKGKYVSVLATVEDSEYKLEQVPKEELHVCSPQYMALEVKMAKKLLAEKALEDPMRSITEIYNEVKESYVATLEPQDWQLFLDNFPSYSQVKPLLCRKRKEQREKSL